VQGPSKRNIFRAQVKDNAWTLEPSATIAYKNAAAASSIPTSPLLLFTVALGLSKTHTALCWALNLQC